MRLKPLLQRLSMPSPNSAANRVVAITHPENRASIRLAERIGMVNERKVLWKGKAAYLFSAKA
jgi:hypothetical protein